MTSSKIVNPCLLNIGVFCLVFLIHGKSIAQGYSIEPDSAIAAYPKMLSLITKIGEEEHSLAILQVQWMDTIFQLERKQANFDIKVPIPKEDNNSYEIYRQAPWDGKGYVLPYANCHGFGLAQSFRHEGIDADAFFSPTTYVDPTALEVVLATAYQKQQTLDGTSMKDLRKTIPIGSLLVFRDSAGVALHTAFQSEEGVLSKNGKFEPRIYHQLDDIKMVYYAATTIDLYWMDADRVKAYLQEQQLHALLKD